MADDDDDTPMYRRRLGEVLRAHGFGWVVEQSEAQIAEGKPNPKQVSERQTFPVDSDPLFEVRAPRGRRASLITSVPYTEEERLEILLHAIDAALVQRAKIETAVVDLLEGIKQVDSIAFEPDVTTGDVVSDALGKAHRIDRGRREAASRIQIGAERALSNIRRRDRAGS